MPKQAKPKAKQKAASHHARVVARASVVGEGVYHASELAGEHHLLLCAAALMLVLVLLRAFLRVE